MFNMICSHGMSCNIRHKIGCNNCGKCGSIKIKLNGVTIKCPDCSNSIAYPLRELLKMVFEEKDESGNYNKKFIFLYSCNYCKLLISMNLPSCFEKRIPPKTSEEIEQERKLQKDKESRETVAKINEESNIIRSEKYDCQYCKKEVNGISKIKVWSDGSTHIVIHCAECSKLLCYPKSAPAFNCLTNDYFKLDFGKYEGKTITEIVDEDREYAEWFLNTPYKSKRKTEDDREKDERNMNSIKDRFKKAILLLDESNKLLYQSLYKNLEEK